MIYTIAPLLSRAFAIMSPIPSSRGSVSKSEDVRGDEVYTVDAKRTCASSGDYNHQTLNIEEFCGVHVMKIPERCEGSRVGSVG
jgi:hypothetical protein